MAASTLSQLSAQLADAVSAAANGVVAIHARRRIPSSGILWRDGIIVSASHTVRREGDVSVTLPNGQTASATIVGRDAATDVIVLRTDASAKAARRGNGALQVGSLVLAVGRPGKDVTASFGIISAIGAGWRTWQGTRIDRVLRLDLAIYDGFSGGPLVDAQGGVLGLNNSALARGAPMSLAADTVDRLVDELLERGHVRRAFIGVAIHPVGLNSSIVEKHNLEQSSGLMVLSVAEGGPAERAGILVGDVLVEANGQTLHRPTDLLDALSSVKAGSTLSARVVRGGKLETVAITPGDRPAEGAGE
jgi:S1-C subfamily serine protease